MTQQELKEYIIARIYPNNAQEITGEALQEALLEIVENAENKEEATAAIEEIRQTIAENQENVAEIDNKIAIVTYNKSRASAVQSSMGTQIDENEAQGVKALAVGIGTRANHDAEFACGRHNVSNSNTLFSVGNGTIVNKKNVFEVRGTIFQDDGNAYVNNRRVLTKADYDALVALLPVHLVVHSTTDYDGDIAEFVEAVQNGRPYDMEVYNTARNVRYKINQVYFASSTRISFYASFEKNNEIANIEVRINPTTNTITAVNH